MKHICLINSETIAIKKYKMFHQHLIMLDSKYITSIRKDGVVIPNHETINRDLDKDFICHTNKIRGIKPKNSYSSIVYGNGEKLKDK